MKLIDAVVHGKLRFSLYSEDHELRRRCEITQIAWAGLLIRNFWRTGDRNTEVVLVKVIQSAVRIIAAFRVLPRWHQRRQIWLCFICRAGGHFKWFVFIEFVHILFYLLHVLLRFPWEILLFEPLMIWRRTPLTRPEVGYISIAKRVHDMLPQNALLLITAIFLRLHHQPGVSRITLTDGRIFGGEFLKVKDRNILIRRRYRLIDFLRQQLIKGVFLNALLINSYQLTSHVKLTLLEEVYFHGFLYFRLIFLDDSLPDGVKHCGV